MAVVAPLTRKYASNWTVPRHPFCKETIRRLVSYQLHDHNHTSTRRRYFKATRRYRSKQLDNVASSSPQLYASESSSEEAEAEAEAEEDQRRRQAQASKGLESLDRYIAILNKQDAKSEDCLPYTSTGNPSRMTSDDDSSIRYKNVTEQRTVDDDYTRESKSSSSSLFNASKDSTNLYLISILISMNIAVFLFEIASPVKNSTDNSLWSLPLMYGAKVNDLIMVGEWWRLFTPMFLHGGVVHIGVSSWALFCFGPQVCKGYGAFTFVLIYLLGGISGNFTSFLHTSDPTVGGSGPVFAVIGAWLVYQAQNKDTVEKENFDSMFQKAIITTALSFVLANFGPIDNWTNLGAVISGIIYGYLTSPDIEIEDASSSSSSDGVGGGNRMKDEITLSSSSRNPAAATATASPCKSLLIFTLFVSAMTSFLLFSESLLVDSLEVEELLQITESPF